MTAWRTVFDKELALLATIRTSRHRSAIWRLPMLRPFAVRALASSYLLDALATTTAYLPPELPYYDGFPESVRVYPSVLKGAVSPSSLPHARRHLASGTGQIRNWPVACFARFVGPVTTLAFTLEKGPSATTARPSGERPISMCPGG